MPESARREFSNYEEFFSFYVLQHSSLGNRVLHAIGTTSGVVIAIAALWMGYGWWALLGLPIAYAFAWTGHFLVEGNKPATFGHPGWSFISDFRMLGLMLTGRLAPYLQSKNPKGSPAARS
jgi:hypothetical protein